MTERAPMDSVNEQTKPATGSAPSGTAAFGALPNIPWEDRPADSTAVLWRSSRNPIIRRDQIARSNSIFNSAVVPFEDGFAGVFRVDDTSRQMNLHTGRSSDGVNWNIQDATIEWAAADSRIGEIQQRFEHAYDPRVTWLDDRYYVTWCNGYNGPTIGIGYTHDFETYQQLDNAVLPFNRNGLLFPRKVGGAYLMLSRPSDNGHTAFGDVYLSESPDLVHWGRHRQGMATRAWTWEATKRGGRAPPNKKKTQRETGWVSYLSLPSPTL